MAFADDTSSKKKQIEPFDAMNPTSPFLNCVLSFSPPALREVSSKAMEFPIKWAFPSRGRALIMAPTVLGARCLLNSRVHCALPLRDNTRSILETDPALIFEQEDYEIYNVSLSHISMSDEPEEVSVDTEEATPEEEEPVILAPVVETTEVSTEEEEVKPVKRGKKELSEEELAEQERIQKIIAAREVIEVDPIHIPVEYETTGKGKIMIGPPTLTRFEKARILGARALQLSLGAPPFISVPKEVATSLDLAYNELEKRVIPITIRRVLPNGDFQNIPIDLFD
jgi:DNA-directed RNA polymerases I, II, and III subunit RPABC2